MLVLAVIRHAVEDSIRSVVLVPQIVGASHKQCRIGRRVERTVEEVLHNRIVQPACCGQGNNRGNSIANNPKIVPLNMRLGERSHNVVLVVAEQIILDNPLQRIGY